jgi:predicted ArsR family transcriptional regulator
MPDMTSPGAQVAPDELVDTVLAASRPLVVLAARGPQGTAELAAALAVNPSTATRMCGRLVRKGLIRRRASAAGSRTRLGGPVSRPRSGAS